VARVGEAHDREAKDVAHRRIEVDAILRLRRVLGLHDHHRDVGVERALDEAAASA
jgi:hypothetical protein